MSQVPQVVSAADHFGLGELLAEPHLSASGWGNRNHVWRVETRRGAFAIKEVVGQLLPSDLVAPAQIEQAAYLSGIPCPEPIRSLGGAWFEPIADRHYRCHRWVTGAAKNNEDVSEAEAFRMGRVVAALHALGLPEDESEPRHVFGREHWLALAQRGSGSSTWPDLVRECLDEILAAESAGASAVDDRSIGSHRDLNAHNVLFSSEGLTLIDWDSAGPISARYETVVTATLWSQRPSGRLDSGVAQSFLRGYRNAGGQVSVDDVSALAGRLNGLTWWTERNVQIALAEPSPTHDALAAGLVRALAGARADLERRREFLREVFAAL